MQIKSIVMLLLVMTFSACNEQDYIEKYIGSYKAIEANAECPEYLDISMEASTLVLNKTHDGSLAEFPLENFNEILIDKACNKKATIAICQGRKIEATENSLTDKYLLIQYINILWQRSESILIEAVVNKLVWNAVKGELYAELGTVEKPSKKQCIYKKLNGGNK